MRHLSMMFAMLIIASLLILPDTASAHTNAAAGTYTVRRGDTLAKIAADQGLSSWRSLYEANRSTIRNPNLIRVGQVLVIPSQGRTAGRTTQAAPVVSNSTSDIKAIITAAARRYGQSPSAMIAVAQCESSLNPRAYNSQYGASGLFQFLPSTWRTTPYANANIFDPYASANAAAWMWSVGRRNEWVCQG